MSRILTPDDIPESMKPKKASTQVLHKNLMIALEKKYPGVSFLYDDHGGKRTAWELEILDFKTGGVLTLKNLWISGRMGVTIKLKNTHDEIERQVVYYAGELLERYNVAREQALDMRENLLGIPRSFTGEAIHQ